MKIRLLDNGSIVIDHAQLMWNIGGGTPVRIPSYGVLIEHDEGLFLFDTGFDYEHTNRVLPFELPEQTEEQTIPAQLELCGFSVSDVTTLVNSHLHFDHVGGNKHFEGTGVPNVVHAREIAQARNHEPFEFFGYSDKTWDYDGARLLPASGDFELAKGLWLYETPGHTVGHYSLLVKPDSGAKPMLFAFDVVYTQEALEKGVQPGFHNDPVAGVRSIRRLKELSEEYGADIYFSHDPEAWTRYKHAPDAYEV
jgi:4-pyridoxolactonase